MNIQRFFGKNSREALTMVRQELGDDAVILSNRAVAGGNEIMAFRQEEMNAIINASPATPALNHDKAEQNTGTAAWLSLLNQHSLEQHPSRETIDAKTDHMRHRAAEHHDADMHRDPQPNKSNAATSKQMVWMLKEMRSMRNVIESQLATIAWGNIQQRDPIKSEVLSTLLGASFSPALSRYLAEKLPQNLDSKKAQTWVKYILSKNLNTIENEAEVLDQGGVFALIGPTGVGKTTTTAKLAARYVMKHGTQNLGLITTDAYRIGGHEQLRIYGKILGVMVHAVKDEADLALALNELKHKHTILIDTVGVSQRDRMVTEQIALLSACNTPIKKLLCLSATNTGETLTDVISAYKGKGLDGCIITKLDEAATIGNTLDVIIRERLKLYYTANGQRVPEDINIAHKKALIDLALHAKSPANRPFEFLTDELPLVMAQAGSAISQLAEI